jgi:hypothetical protein
MPRAVASICEVCRAAILVGDGEPSQVPIQFSKGGREGPLGAVPIVEVVDGLREWDGTVVKQDLARLAGCGDIQLEDDAPEGETLHAVGIGRVLWLKAHVAEAVRLVMLRAVRDGIAVAIAGVGGLIFLEIGNRVPVTFQVEARKITDRRTSDAGIPTAHIHGGARQSEGFDGLPRVRVPVRHLTRGSVNGCQALPGRT